MNLVSYLRKLEIRGSKSEFSLFFSKKLVFRCNKNAPISIDGFILFCLWDFYCTMYMLHDCCILAPLVQINDIE